MPFIISIDLAPGEHISKFTRRPLILDRARLASVLFVPLHERRILRILLGEAEREFGDESASDGKANEERPVTVPFSLKEYWPWIELPHPSLFRFFLHPSDFHGKASVSHAKPFIFIKYPSLQLHCFYSSA